MTSIRAETTAVIVPVGFDLGPVVTGEHLPQRYEVRLGGSRERLTGAEYGIWQAAFADADGHAALAVDRETLVRRVRLHEHTSRDDADPVIAHLQQRGLLLEFDPDGDLEDVFGVLRLYPRARGLGSRPDEPREYAIGDDEDAYTCVPPNVYTVWSFGLTSPTLWDACERVAADADVDLPVGAEPVELTAAEVAQQVAYELPLLLSTGAAVLDLLNYELPRIPAPVELPAATNSDTGDEVIVPVGLSLGRDYADDAGSDGRAGAWYVHLGTDYAELDAAEATVWGAAFVDPRRYTRGAATRADLVERARAGGTPAPDEVVARLLDRGLLLELRPGGAELDPLFRAVQLYPLGEGLGNTTSRPGLFRIGRRARSYLSVRPEVYAIWAHAPTDASLWDACVGVAGGLGDSVTADELAGEVGAVLPALIASGAAFLDRLNYAV